MLKAICSLTILSLLSFLQLDNPIKNEEFILTDQGIILNFDLNLNKIEKGNIIFELNEEKLIIEDVKENYHISQLLSNNHFSFYYEGYKDLNIVYELPSENRLLKSYQVLGLNNNTSFKDKVVFIKDHKKEYLSFSFRNKNKEIFIPRDVNIKTNKLILIEGIDKIYYPFLDFNIVCNLKTYPLSCIIEDDFLYLNLKDRILLDDENNIASLEISLSLFYSVLFVDDLEIISSNFLLGDYSSYFYRFEIYEY